jgi:hypothetical protein
MRIFASPLERAISHYDDAVAHHVDAVIDESCAENQVTHARALVVAEKLLEIAYGQAGTKEPWVSYEAGYKLEDAGDAQLFLDTVQTRLDKRRAVTRRHYEDDSIVVEDVELAPPTHATVVIEVKAPLDPFEQLREDYGKMLPIMMRLYPH